jgi:hypothetical protein
VGEVSARPIWNFDRTSSAFFAACLPDHSAKPVRLLYFHSPALPDLSD